MFIVNVYVFRPYWQFRPLFAPAAASLKCLVGDLMDYSLCLQICDMRFGIIGRGDRARKPAIEIDHDSPHVAAHPSRTPSAIANTQACSVSRRLTEASSALSGYARRSPSDESMTVIPGSVWRMSGLGINHS
jgi:hypothetical protein